jgi:hypothetical protein
VQVSPPGSSDFNPLFIIFPEHEGRIRKVPNRGRGYPVLQRAKHLDYTKEICRHPTCRYLRQGRDGEREDRGKIYGSDGVKLL